MKSEMAWIHLVSNTSQRPFKIFKTLVAQGLCLCLSLMPNNKRKVRTNECGSVRVFLHLPGPSGNTLDDFWVANSLLYHKYVRRRLAEVKIRQNK